MAYKTVEVEIDLSDFDDDELIEEIESRSLIGSIVPTNLNEQRQAMLRALWDGDEARVIELLKTYLCDCMGRSAI